MVIDIVIKDRK